MKTHTLLLSLAVFAAAAASLEAQTYTWDGTTDPNASGNWSTATNWSTDVVPGSANTAVLPDVTSGTRIITYDAGAPNTLGTLTITQATAGNVNRLDYVRAATVTNAITLGATAGTAEISVTPGTSSIVLTATGGLTLNANGLLVLNASVYTNTTVTPNTTAIVAGSVAGAVTLNGGTLEVGGLATTTSTTSNVSGGVFTMNSGTIQIDNSTANGGLGDRRIEFLQNVTVNGGAITTASASGQFNMDGATNVLNPSTAVPTGLSFSLSGTAQTLSTNQALTGVLVRNTGVKTITRTGGSTTIGAISMIDANTTATGTTTLQLGSDLALIAGATQPTATNYSQGPDANGAVQFGIDANGHTLNLSTGGSSGVYTPNASGQTGTSAVTSTVYTFSSTAAGGVIAANAFNLSTASVTTNVNAGLTLLAIGAGGTTTTLSGTGTIAAGSIFQYAGPAVATTPAILTSTRTIGALTVGNGTTASVLQIGGNAGLTVANNVTAAAGSTLQLGGQTLTLSSTANLTGTGTVAGTTAGTVSTGNAVTFTGTGGIVPGTNGTVGALTLTGTQALTLASGSVSRFDIVDATTADNDHVTLNTTGTITLNYAGTLALTFLNGYQPDAGTSFQIVDANPGATGNFTSITSNISPDTFSFAPATGVLTVTAVPEASGAVHAGLFITSVFGAVALRYRKRRKARVS